MMEEPETGFQLMEEVIAVLPPWAPDIADVYTRRAMLYALVGNHEAALTDFETALTQNPGFAPCFYYRGLYYADRGEIESARADLTHYLELQPDGKFAEEATEYLENL
jgi:lipoprotein NlpI